MAIEERIPEMSDKELATFQDNAARLALSGTPQQKANAERLIPLISAEQADRRARAPVKPARAPAAKKAPRKTAAKKKASAE